MLGPSDFVGDWRVRRVIDDRRAPGPDAPAGRVDGHFEGVARFAAEADGLRYHERGTLTLRAAGVSPMVAERTYLWRWEAGGVSVRFGDGRPFHRFVPDGRGAGTDHPCGADLYRVAYDFAAWPVWATEWTVSGPSKEYRMATAYARA